MRHIETDLGRDFGYMANRYRSLANTEPHALQAALFAAIAEDYGELAAAALASPVAAPELTTVAGTGFISRWRRFFGSWPAVPSSSQA